MLHSENIKIRDKDYILETGAWARQANGSVVIRWGKITLIANATAAKDANPDAGFFPLTVDYREKFYASGQIPGGYFKREARPTEKEILTSRLTDRPLRPLFPKSYYNEVQIFITLLSSDGQQSADVHAITAASAALMVSDIPFAAPAAGVRVGLINGNFILFPDKNEMQESKLNLILAGTEEAVTMIEGYSHELDEKTMLDAIKFGHTEIKRICECQNQLREKAGKIKNEFAEQEENVELKNKIREMAFNSLVEANKSGDKQTRQSNLNDVNASTIEKLETEYKAESLDEKEISSKIKEARAILEDLEVEIVRNQIFNEAIRADGRKLDEIRPISIEVGVLPGTHGSSIFTRGETQSLGVVTLGTENDAQFKDDVEGETISQFYLHYNFLPFSVGEVRRYGGPGRREIGHGKLAENALTNIIPSQSEFPYVMRIVSEIFESNGSSSMATVCSGSLALMDAGVPIKGAVAGIAMGLITQDDKYAVLSDIAGLEDHFGDMDFKVAGTSNGITAFQMDLKLTGISYEIMEKALEQAKTGRMHILGRMNEVLSAPRSELSENAPRITTLQIDKERIGELIGPGGKNIRSIIEKSGAEINVNDDGVVSIASTSSKAADIAREMIEGQFAEAEINKIYEGTVKKIVDFGAFIEILPGKDGLCHISKISTTRVSSVEEALKEGDVVKVKVIAVDRQGKISLSIKDAVNGS
ncbi:MAG: polyribonucleotide nucleotidyltransferase [Spirochaetia bacterium]|nr:polyribonucleotide nucleotidyltransferase [Spirochaetia bacterium]